MNIFITGQRGLIGSALKKRLIKEGHQIVGQVDLRDGKNILNLKNLKTNIKIDLMIHSAAFCKINKSIEIPNLANYNNSEGTYQVLEFCRKNKIPKILFFSSSRVLNKEKNIYTASKTYGEELCKAYSKCYGIKYLIIRPSTVYGPFWDRTRRLMHIFIINALLGKDLEIYGNPKTKTLDFSYIDDFVEGVMLALKGEQDKEYALSGEEEFKIFDLAKMIVEKTDSKSQIKVYKEEISQPQEVKVDNSKIKKIGYKPKISIKEGVERSINWYKKFLKRKLIERNQKIKKRRRILIILKFLFLFYLLSFLSFILQFF